MEKLIRILDAEAIPYRRNLDLSAHSTFRIGGAAALAVSPENENQMLRVLELADEGAFPLYVVGNGSNLVFPDKGLEGITVFTGGMKHVTVDGKRITAEAGVHMRRLSAICRDAGLSGLEYAYGIPGTLGGAICMNAGAYNGDIAGVCRSVRYYDRDRHEIVEISKKDCRFGYRTSVFSTHPTWVILSAALDMATGRQEKIGALMEKLQQKRREAQPLAYPSAGSTFKRPEGDSAARLIDQVCHLKGLRVGDAQVSEKHAGFVVNLGHATAQDVKALVALVHDRVLAETGVDLETEIQFLE